MKKSILYVLFVALMSVALSSCSSKTRIKMECEAANKDCPMDLGYGMFCSSIEYDDDDNAVKYNVKCNPQIYQAIEVAPEEIKENIVEMFNDGDKDIIQLAKLCKESNTCIKFQFKDKQSGDKTTITIHPDEM